MMLVCAGNVLAAGSTTVVISQIYGGGGNTSATYKNDFIELHNVSAASVSISGWSVQYAGNNGTTWSVTALTGTSIPAGGYYLVQEASGGTPGSTLPTSDNTAGTINLAAGSGKVALVTSTTAITGGNGSAPTVPSGAIVDFVGYGTATWFETAAAPTVSDNIKSVQRKNSGMQDTDNNSSDFTSSSTAAARNSSTAVYGPPSLTTQAASSLSTSGATLNGTITANNGSTLTDRGFYWSGSSTVTTSSTQLSEGGTGLTAYTKALTGLSVNTIYYYRAYAVNGAGTTLDSADTSFYTLAAIPSAPTVNNPTTSSLDVTIGANGNPSITTYAIATGAQFVQTDGTLGGSPVYQTLTAWGTKTVAGLNPGTLYSFTVQAKNGAGTTTSFGSSASGTTTSATTYTVTYDGNVNTGGTAPTDPNSPYASGATVTVLGNTGGLTKSGSSFAGWNTASDGSGTAYGVGATFVIGANTTLYAVWTSSPTISGGATAAAFTTTYGTASSAQTFAVSGVNLTTDLIATAPTGFEVSSDGTTYGATATFTQSGGSASGTLRVRLKATAPVGGSYNSQAIALTSTGASTVNINTASSGNTVTPKALTIGSPTIASKPYDATTTAGAVTVGTLSGFVGSETVTATATAAAYSSANAASYPSDVVTYTLHDGTGGGLAANYNLANGAATGVITPLALSTTAPSIADKTYNGATTAGTVTVGTLSGFVGSETVTATATAANYSSANVGTYSGNVVTYTLHDGTGGGLAANYSLANGTANGNITAKALTITANSVTKTVGATLTGGAGSTAFTSSGLVSGETIGSVTVAYGSGAAAGDAVGTYSGQVTPSAATGGTFAAGNYNISYAAGDIIVVPPLMVGWDFQTTSGGGTAAVAAPGSPTTYTANFGSGTIYLDGSFGSSAWTSLASSPQLTAFGGTAVNTSGTSFSTTTTGSSCLGLANNSANGQKIVFKFSMVNKFGLVVSYATQGTASGFTSQTWEYSTDGVNWTAAQIISSIPTSFATTTLNTITALNGVSTAYLRLTVTGATGPSGNNRLDNIQIRASDVPTISGVTASQSINYGTANVTLSGIVSAASPLYPANGETVSVTINGSTQPATISGGAGVFSVVFPTATIPASATPYTITYHYAGNSYLGAAADNTGTTLTVDNLVVPNLNYTNTPGIARIITLSEIQAAGLASSLAAPQYKITVGLASNGGAVFTNSAGTLMKYTNSPSFAPTSDSFTYTVFDGAVSAGGTVTITFTNVAGPSLTAGTDGNGHAVVSFQALPGYSYHMQRATTLGPPPDWTNAEAITLPSPGNGSYSWTNLVSPPEGFYRLSYP